jgi:dTDP-4-amino-4,6-dideoxygalactose transaminase
VCGFGYAAAFSFYPGKSLGAHGEGGSLTTNDHAVAQFAREMRTHGESKRYFHDRIGYNYRMDGFQGAVLNVKLKYLDRWTARRQELARPTASVSKEAAFGFPRTVRDARAHTICLPSGCKIVTRFEKSLLAEACRTAVHYPVPVHLQKAYSHLGYKAGLLPHTEKARAEVISMPLFPEMSREQVLYAAGTLADVAGGCVRESAS